MFGSIDASLVEAKDANPFLIWALLGLAEPVAQPTTIS